MTNSSDTASARTIREIRDMPLRDRQDLTLKVLALVLKRLDEIESKLTNNEGTTV
jgi:hypothetical protein